MHAVALAIIFSTLPTQTVANDTPASMAAQIDELLNTEVLSGAKVGVYIKRLNDGRELYTRNADTFFIPASNIKLITSAAALHYFGPSYRFLTEVYFLPNGESKQSGDIIIKGNGDPLFTYERAWYLASRIYYAGIRTIGNIIVDDSFFPGPHMANGWKEDHSDYAYMAPNGAVSVGFNTVLIHVQPNSIPGALARVIVEPTSNYVTLDNAATTVSRRRTRLSIDVVEQGKRSRVRVSGRINMRDSGRAYYRRITNPPIYAGEAIKAMLQQFGIKVYKSVSVGLTPPDATRLTSVGSPTLTEIIYKLNKHSNNFMAEQLALALGAARFGAPGSWSKSQSAFDDFLINEVGLQSGSYRISNASGLHSVNSMTPRQIAAVLEFMYHNSQIAPEFISSLAVAGASGTLSERMRTTEASRLLRAKTGTLSISSALSGYVPTRNGDTLVFSLLVNDYQSPVSEVWQVQNKIGALMARMRFLNTPESMAEATSTEVREVAIP
ncbi:MAG: D-alanyl-D-alanine carboxypeptidase/D-alanyl-D-alanine-endopeptidase [Deltaproteobacteria bacterium]|nr:D-alanyl-D-alanine carboxypeptidase/D-alanyl-D-alanine-endopeptidase [Deltaproteobacteria bacterium]